MTSEVKELVERLHTCRSAVSASPFYSPEQREAVLFTLHLIEFGEPPSGDPASAEPSDPAAAYLAAKPGTRLDAYARAATRSTLTTGGGHDGHN